MKELGVSLLGKVAGQLVLKRNGNMQFRYRAGYSGRAVSWAMPVREQAYPHALCRAVFGGLLIEGDSRTAVASRLHVSAGNDFGLLAELGGDCAGALSFLPVGERLPELPSERPLGKADFDGLIESLPQRPLGADPKSGIRLSLAGAQSKLPLILRGNEFALPLNSAAATTHIVKPEPARFPGLVDNEHFCMQLASDLGLDVAPTRKGRTGGGIPFLLVTRYDRESKQEPVLRVHQEDFCQALGCPSDRKYQSEGGPSAADCFDLLREVSSRPAIDIPALWRALVLNWLIGNCDAHGKNFSILYAPDGPRLAPLYDLVSTTVFEELDRRMAMRIGDALFTEEVRLGDWLILAEAAKISSQFARESLLDLASAIVAKASAAIDKGGKLNRCEVEIAAGVRDRASGLTKELRSR